MLWKGAHILQMFQAVLLQRCLKRVELRGVYQASEVLQELSSRTKEAQANPRKTIKSQKVRFFFLSYFNLMLPCPFQQLVF